MDGVRLLVFEMMRKGERKGRRKRRCVLSEMGWDGMLGHGGETLFFIDGCMHALVSEGSVNAKKRDVTT